MRRREFITLLGGAASAWPSAARTQQAAIPVIGLLDPGSVDSSARKLAGFVKGLNSAGYIDGKNVAIEYHLLEGQYDRVPEVLAEAMRQGSIRLLKRSEPSVCGFSMSSCRRRIELPCSSIRTMRQPPRRRCATCRTPPPFSVCK